MEKRDVYAVAGELFHGTPGGSDMRPFQGSDLDTYVAEALASNTSVLNAGLAQLSEQLDVTATADGTGTGTITPTSASAAILYVQVTSDDANKIVVLPALTGSTLPNVVILVNGSTGYELRTNAPSVISINGGAASNAESAIAADTAVVMIKRGAQAWVGFQIATNGAVSAVEVAA